MAVIERSACVAFSANQMLALVNDIDAYPEFLHWCRGARVERRQGSAVDAAMDIGIAGISRTMRTRNTTTIHKAGGSAHIQIDMLDGPLKSLHGHWRLADREPTGCDVVLRLEYEVPRSPFGLIIRGLFDEIANSQLNAFIARADVVYGER
jgi:ribosome-associated toxin RatA of RatAB toxin-antitoxin module